MQALTPAMEQWRKRIGQIAINFETHKVDGKSDKQLKPTYAAQKLSEVHSDTLPHHYATSMQLDYHTTSACTDSPIQLRQKAVCALYAMLPTADGASNLRQSTNCLIYIMPVNLY